MPHSRPLAPPSGLPSLALVLAMAGMGLGLSIFCLKSDRYTRLFLLAGCGLFASGLLWVFATERWAQERQGQAFAHWTPEHPLQAGSTPDMNRIYRIV